MLKARTRSNTDPYTVAELLSNTDDLLTPTLSKDAFNAYAACRRAGSSGVVLVLGTSSDRSREVYVLDYLKRPMSESQFKEEAGKNPFLDAETDLPLVNSCAHKSTNIDDFCPVNQRQRARKIAQAAVDDFKKAHTPLPRPNCQRTLRSCRRTKRLVTRLRRSWHNSSS